jgi:hypothetical protein
MKDAGQRRMGTDFRNDIDQGLRRRAGRLEQHQARRGIINAGEKGVFVDEGVRSAAVGRQVARGFLGLREVTAEDEYLTTAMVVIRQLMQPVIVDDMVFWVFTSIAVCTATRDCGHHLTFSEAGSWRRTARRAASFIMIDHERLH